MDVQEFQNQMDKLKEASLMAAKWVEKVNPKVWSRAFFSDDSPNEAREKHISDIFGTFRLKVIGWLLERSAKAGQMQNYLVDNEATKLNKSGQFWNILNL
ncbi:hypothetical protein ACLOJK_013149 [Asimina triloba]